MNISSLELRNFVYPSSIKKQTFNYGGFEGIAELLGWQIVFFKDNDGDLKTKALLFESIVNPQLIKIANHILDYIEFPILFGENKDKMLKLYGKPDSEDGLYEDMVRYNYLLKEDAFLVFGFKDNKLEYLEIISDPQIAKQVSGFRNSL